MFTSNCILLNLKFQFISSAFKNTVIFKGHSSLSAHHLKIELRIRKLKYSFYLHAIPIKIEKLSLREMFFHIGTTKIRALPLIEKLTKFTNGKILSNRSTVNL